MGRVALVTGGSRGIGAAISKALKEAGYSVAANYAGNDEAANAFKAETGIPVYKWSVADYDACAAGIAQVEADLGPVDVLVNNAGFSRDKYLTRMDEEMWDLVHGVVLKGTFHCCRRALPGMMDRRWGRIVNIASMSYLGTAGQTNYSSAKAGLVGFTAALAREAGPFNITVNAVAPGLVATPRLRARPDFPKLEQKSKALTPLPRLAEAEDIAKAILFHASSLADFVSAQVMHVSGGR